MIHRPDANVSDAGVAEAGVAEAGVSEAGVSEAGISEAGGTYCRPGGTAHIYKLTLGRDIVITAPGPGRIDATSGTLSQGDVIVAGPASDDALVLRGGGQFDLAAPRVLRGISRIIDHGIGDTRITLRAGLAATLRLGTDFPTVVGADDRVTIIGGAAGFDTIMLGSAGESVIAGSAGMAITMPAADAGAHIQGGGVAALTVTGTPGQCVSLGANIQGISELTIADPGMIVDLAGAGIASTVLMDAGTRLSVGGADAVVVDEAGGNVVAMQAPGQTLELPNTGVDRGGTETVTAISPGDSIVVDLPPGNSQLSYDPATGVAVLTDSANQVSEYLMMPIGLPGLSLSAAPDLPNGDTGTRITVDGVSDPPVPCFAEGTTLATFRGELPVEAIRVGDLLMTEQGAPRPVRWIGERTVHCAAYRRQDLVQPVRILAGAFAPGLPRRDVLLSPDHCVALDGALVPVRHLVNGGSVRTEHHVRLRYFHIEVDGHAIALSAGLPVETYLDTGNRALLDPRAAFIDHDGRLAVPDRSRACAPLVEQGRLLRAHRLRLMRRAEAMGFATTDEAAARLIADGAVIAGTQVAGGLSFLLPAPPRSLRLCSRAGAPAETDIDSTDRRRLGIALAGLTLFGAGTARRVDVFGPAWGAGFYAPEKDADGAFRWSDGDAAFNPGMWAGLDGPLRLTLHVRATLRYRLMPQARVAPPAQPVCTPARAMSSA